MSLVISKLEVVSNGTPVVQGVSLTINPGELHVIMGANGSGKTSLASALMGHPRYPVTSGTIELDGADITAFTPDKRAKLGLFLTQQYPPTVSGVSTAQFLRLAKNNLTSSVANPLSFNKELRQHLSDAGLNETFLTRNVNEGFSGGEKKRAELAALLTLNPRYAVLDEIDSGLDVDGVKMVAGVLAKFLGTDKGVLLISHSPHLLKNLKPSYVHIMRKGKIIKTGSAELSAEIEKTGYESFNDND